MQKRIVNAGRMSLALFTLVLLFVPSMRAQGDAEKNYKAKCAGCHAVDGSGGTGAGKAMGVHDFRSPEVQKETDAQLAGIISNGKGKMPKYADKLKEAEIKDLTACVRDLGKK